MRFIECDCGLTGGCEKCNPQISRSEYFPFLEPVKKIGLDIIYRIAEKIHEDSNYILREDYCRDIVALVLKELGLYK